VGEVILQESMEEWLVGVGGTYFVRRVEGRDSCTVE
jgi:hypothetical protein